MNSLFGYFFLLVCFSFSIRKNSFPIVNAEHENKNFEKDVQNESFFTKYKYSDSDLTFLFDAYIGKAENLFKLEERIFKHGFFGHFQVKNNPGEMTFENILLSNNEKLKKISNDLLKQNCKAKDIVLAKTSSFSIEQQSLAPYQSKNIKVDKGKKMILDLIENVKERYLAKDYSQFYKLFKKLDSYIYIYGSVIMTPLSN